MKNDELDLKSITMETATLFALFLCQRAQTIFTLFYIVLFLQG